MASDGIKKSDASFLAMLRADGETRAARLLEMQRETARIHREIDAINVLLTAGGQIGVDIPLEAKTQAHATARRPVRKRQYETMLYRDAVIELLRVHGQMTADHLTREIFEDCSPEAFRRAKNSLVGALSTEVRGGYLARPHRSVFALGPRLQSSRATADGEGSE